LYSTILRFFVSGQGQILDEAPFNNYSQGMKKKRKNRSSKWFQQLEYSSVGIEIGLSVACGALLGYFLDKWLDTAPWMLFFWFFCGIAAGFRAMLLTLKKLKNDNKSESPEPSHDSDPK